MNTTHWPLTLTPTVTPSAVLESFVESLNNAPYPVTGLLESAYDSVKTTHTLAASCIRMDRQRVIAIVSEGLNRWPCCLYVGSGMRVIASPIELEKALQVWTHTDEVISMLSVLCVRGVETA